MLTHKAITADDKTFHAHGVHDLCRAKVGEFFLFYAQSSYNYHYTHDLICCCFLLIFNQFNIL